MADKVELQTKPASRKAIQDTFFRRYGRAIAAWADIEQAIAFWFLHLCDPNWQHAHMHISIFYSARSFNGSVDMFKAALSKDIRDKELSDFCREAIRVTACYYQFRNRLAHHVAVYNRALNKMFLVQPQQNFSHMGFGLSDRDFVVATRNFKRLKRNPDYS